MKQPWSRFVLRGQSLKPMRPPWFTWIHHSTLMMEPEE